MIDRTMVSRVFSNVMDERLASCVTKTFFNFSKSDWITKSQFIQGLNECCFGDDDKKMLAILKVIKRQNNNNNNISYFY